MKLTLEAVRIAFYLGYALILSIAFDGLLFELPFNPLLLLIPLLGLLCVGSYFVVKSLKSKQIRMRWLTMQTDLIVHFSDSDGDVIAYDEDENCYKIGLLLMPERID